MDVSALFTDAYSVALVALLFVAYCAGGASAYLLERGRQARAAARVKPDS